VYVPVRNTPFQSCCLCSWLFISQYNNLLIGKLIPFDIFLQVKTRHTSISIINSLKRFILASSYLRIQSNPMALQPMSGLGLLSRLLLRFRNSSFLWCGVVSPTPNPQPGRPGLRIYDPLETGWPSYNPGHWVARVCRGCHSPYPLLWAPEGLSCFSAASLFCPDGFRGPPGLLYHCYQCFVPGKRNRSER
jgi:hypothetical protein